MKTTNLCLAALLLAAALAAAPRRAAATETLMVRQPPALATAYPTGLVHRAALFGFPSFQASVVGTVVYGTPGDLDGCMPLNRTLIADERAGVAEGGDLIVMVDRGNCSFAQKVFNIQQVGASAAVIVNNASDGVLPYMRDDDTGKNIEIPSFLVRKDDGQAIKDYVAQYDTSGPVVLEMSWGLPHPDNRTEWKLWTTSIDPLAVEFKRDFRVVSQALGTAAEMEVGYYTYRGYSATPASMCTNGRLYCSLPPESASFPGRVVVKENLRQYCLWEHGNRTRNIDTWWEYAARWTDECMPTITEDSHIACDERLLREIGVDPSVIDTCVAASGGFEDGARNTVLDQMYADEHEERVFYLPYLLINEEPYRGSFSCPNPVAYEHCGLLQALCAGFDEASQPKACANNDGCPLLQERDICGICGGDGTRCVDQTAVNGTANTGGGDRGDGDGGGTSVGTVIGIVAAVVVVVVAGVILYVRRQRQQMRLDLDHILSSYMPLDSDGKPVQSGGGGRGRGLASTADDEDETLM